MSDLPTLCVALLTAALAGVDEPRFREGEKLEGDILHTYAEIVFDDEAALRRWRKLKPQFAELPLVERVGDDRPQAWVVRIPKTVDLRKLLVDPMARLERGYRYLKYGKGFTTREEAEAALASGKDIFAGQGETRATGMRKDEFGWTVIGENKFDLVADQHLRMRSLAWQHRYLIQRPIGKIRWHLSVGRVAFRPPSPYSMYWGRRGWMSSAECQHPAGGWSSAQVGLVDEPSPHLRHDCLTRMAYLNEWQTLVLPQGNAVVGRGRDELRRPSGEVFWQHDQRTVVMIRFDPKVDIKPLVREYMKLHPPIWPPRGYEFTGEKWARQRVEIALERMQRMLRDPQPESAYSKDLKGEVFDWQTGVHAELHDIEPWFDTPFTFSKPLGDKSFVEVVTELKEWWKHNPPLRHNAPDMKQHTDSG